MTEEMHTGPDFSVTGSKRQLLMLWHRDWGHKLRQFVVVPGGKQVHLGKMPPVADLSKDIQIKRPLHLNDLSVSGQLVDYQIQPTQYVVCPQTNLPEVAPGQVSPKEGTESDRMPLSLLK